MRDEYQTPSTPMSEADLKDPVRNSFCCSGLAQSSLQSVRCWYLIRDEAPERTTGRCAQQSGGCAHGGHRTRSDVYFPSSSVVSSYPTSLWKHYSHHMAYLDVYHTYLKELDAEKQDLLDSDLRLIFSHLQCLPTGASSKWPHIVWQAHQNKLQFVANSRYYRISGIGQSTKSLMQTTHKAQFYFYFYFFDSTIYNVGLEHSPRGALQIQVTTLGPLIPALPPIKIYAS
jgi:hypothetical protein